MSSTHNRHWATLYLQQMVFFSKDLWFIHDSYSLVSSLTVPLLLRHSQTRPSPNPRHSPAKRPDWGSRKPVQRSTDERRLTSPRAYDKVMSRTRLSRALPSSDSRGVWGFLLSFLRQPSHFTVDQARQWTSPVPASLVQISRLRQGYFCHVLLSWCQTRSIQRIAHLTCRLRFRRAHLLRISKWSSWEVIPFDSVQFNPDRFGSVLSFFFAM